MSTVRLALTLYSIIATTLAGSAVAVALVIGQDDLAGLLFAATGGFLAAVPVSVLIARRLIAS